MCDLSWTTVAAAAVSALLAGIVAGYLTTGAAVRRHHHAVVGLLEEAGEVRAARIIRGADRPPSGGRFDP